MLINKRILLFTLLSGAICSVFAVQYSDSIGWKNLPYIKQSEAWLNSENAAGLHTLSIPRITTAEVYVDKQNGGFIDYFHGKHLVVINKSATAREVGAELTISAPIGEILSQITA